VGWMEDDKKAKILLNDGSFIEFITKVLGKNNIQDFMVEEYFTEELTKQSQDYERAFIASNWSEEAQDFIADGYSRDDIEYEDYEELDEDLTRDIILDITQYYLEKYFNNDNDMLDDMEKYVKSCL
jgi:hypothetical protein